MATYTHGHHESVLRSHSSRTIANSAAYLRPHLTAQTKLLDVGAGPGSITVDFAGVVSHVTATEIDENTLALSRALAAERSISNLAFSVEDVHALSFADDSFDVVHTHQVLQHVADPVQALREMRRVTVPGGIVAARDADYAGFLSFPVLPELDEWLRLYREAARANGGEPMPAGVCSRGPGPQGSTTSPRRHPPGVTRRPRTGPGGAGCGPTAFSNRRSLVSSSTRRWRRPPICRRSVMPGGGGRMPATAGISCRTARSSAASDARAPRDTSADGRVASPARVP